MRLKYRVKIGIILVLTFIFFFTLNLTPLGKTVKNFFYFMSLPIQKSFWRAGDRVSNFFEVISEMKNLKKEVADLPFIDTLRYAWVNKELKLKLQELLAENASLKELKKENEILREVLGLGLQKEFKLEITQAIGKDISSDTILINKGFRDDLRENLPVITQQKILVGKISEVYKNFSKVMLISNKESSFDAEVQDRETLGVIKGEGNFQVLLDLIPQEKEIREGDIVITTSLGGIFPRGLLVGEIKEIIKSDIELWQQAKIKPSFNIQELETLFIIKEF